MRNIEKAEYSRKMNEIQYILQLSNDNMNILKRLINKQDAIDSVRRMASAGASPDGIRRYLQAPYWRRNISDRQGRYY